MAGKDRSSKQQPSSSKEFPTQLIDKFLSNQSLELKNQSQENELRKLNESNSYDYACKALEAQKEDRKESRQQATLFMKFGFVLTIMILILTSIFIYYCINSGNISLLYSILKGLALMIPTLLGGYFYGLNRGKKISQKESQSFEVVDE